MLNNVADFGVLISSAEGWGLSVSESLLCETPVIGTRCGGIQDQLIGADGQEFGACLLPTVKPLVGSQVDTPYIFDSYVSKEDFLAALHKMYDMPKEARKALGRDGRDHIMQNFNYETFGQQWVDLVDALIETEGSWKERKGYTAWELKQI